MVKMNDPQTVVVEIGGQNNTLVDWLEQNLREEKLFVPVYRYHSVTEAARMRLEGKPTSPVGKSNRIEFMERRFANHQVFVRRGLTQIFNELTTYDGVRARHHFDLLDALAQAMTVDTAPVAYSFEQETEEKETQWHERVKSLANVGAGTAQDRDMAAGRWTGR